MSLPTKVIDRLFSRLALTYGSQWMALWQGADLNEVKSLWGSELSLFSDRLEAIGWALENLPERPPNLVQFKALCRQARRVEAAALPLPERNPERMREALQGLRVLAGGEAEASGQPMRLGGRLRNGLTPAQSVVEGLCARGDRDGLNPAQVSVLRACVAILADDDARRDHPVVARYVRAEQSQEA